MFASFFVFFFNFFDIEIIAHHNTCVGFFGTVGVLVCDFSCVSERLLGGLGCE